jgi:hypothetical protein
MTFRLDPKQAETQMIRSGYVEMDRPTPGPGPLERRVTDSGRRRRRQLPEVFNQKCDLDGAHSSGSNVLDADDFVFPLAGRRPHHHYITDLVTDQGAGYR